MARCANNAEQERMKHSRKIVSPTKDSLEVVHKPFYHRRHVSKFRHVLKLPEASKDSLDCITDDRSNVEQNVSFRDKTKRREHKKRCKEHNVRKQIFEEEDINPDIIPLKTKDKHLAKNVSRMANDYRKLSKRYKKVLEQYQTLSTSMERREAEYEELQSRYETVVETLRKMESTKVDLVRRSKKLEAERTQSNEDIALLKSIVYQLNAELERYQDKVENQKSANSFVNIGNKEENRYDRRVWGGVSFHALAPLLNAYEENISEKQELVNMYEHEMANFGSRCKEILSENELMHREVEELRIECNRYEKEVTSIVENTALLKKQNDVLQKEIADLKDEAVEIRSTFESKVEMILKRNDALKKEHTTNLSELNNLRGKYEVLWKEYEKIKSKEEQTVPTTVHFTAIEECKTLLDELKHQHEVEKRNLSNRIKHMEEDQPENEKKLVMVTAERNHLKTLVENLEKNLKRSQRKAEDVRTALHSTRVSRDSLKEQLNKATDYCENLFSEYERIVAEREKLMTLLRETEKENVEVDRLGKTIASRVHNLKTQLENVRRGAKQQVETVEKRIKVQELKVRRMKREYRRKIEYLRDTIKQKEETIEQLQKEKHSDRNKSTRHLPSTLDEKPEIVLPEGK